MERRQVSYLEKYIGKYVLVKYIENQKNLRKLGRLIKVDFNGVIIKTVIEHKFIRDDYIQKIVKKNVIFLKQTVGIDPDEEYIVKKINTSALKIIEDTKKIPNVVVLTNSARFSNKKRIKKEKLEKGAFEMDVFEWIKTRQTVEFCPLALINNEFLFAIYMRRFVLFKKNMSILLAHKDVPIQEIIDNISTHNVNIENMVVPVPQEKEISIQGLADLARLL